MSLLARYVLNDSSNFKKDISEKTNGVIGGTLAKAKIPAPGFSACAEFNGINNYIQIGRSPMNTESITVSAWAYSEDWSKHYSTIMSCADSGGWDIWKNTDNKLSFECSISGVGYKVAPDDVTINSLSKGWHLFVGTYAKGHLKFYRDGKLKSDVYTGSDQHIIRYNGSNSIYIGAEANGTSVIGPYFKGCLSDVRIYSEALSASQVENMYKYPNSISIENQGKKILSNGGEFIEGSSVLSLEKFGDIKCNSIVECHTFTSAATYSAANCLNYSTRNDNVLWDDPDLVNGKIEKDKKWINGSVICLVIPCDNGTFYISYQTVIDRTHLKPLKLYNVQINKKPFMVLGKDKKIYFNEFVEC